MSLVRLVDTGECVHADWAAENAVQKNGAYYANDPDQSSSGAKDKSSATPGSDFERGQAIATTSEQARADPTADFVKGKEIARSLQQPTKSRGTSR